MKNMVEFLQKNGYVFKKLNKINNKDLGTRKKIDIYEAVNLKSFYVAIFKLNQKSRFIMKNANDLEALYHDLVSLQNHNFKIKVLLVNSPVCSKSKEFLKKNKWKIYDIV